MLRDPHRPRRARLELFQEGQDNAPPDAFLATQQQSAGKSDKRQYLYSGGIRATGLRYPNDGGKAVQQALFAVPGRDAATRRLKTTHPGREPDADKQRAPDQIRLQMDARYKPLADIVETGHGLQQEACLFLPMTDSKTHKASSYAEQ